MEILNKLENPTRLKELNPTETLIKIGVNENPTICDIGAGTGIFTIAASELTENKVYALEINPDMLSLINEKAKSNNISNIELVAVENDYFDITTNSIDIAIVVTVFHEIQNKPTFLSEVMRILKPTGKVAFIEFHNRVTPMGPPPAHRIGIDDLKQTLTNNCFIEIGRFDLGENFYCAVFQPN